MHGDVVNELLTLPDGRVRVCRSKRQWRGHLPAKILFTETLQSDGNDDQSIIPEVEPVYLWDRSTNESFDKDEGVSILDGADFDVSSLVNDMHSHVRVQFV